MRQSRYADLPPVAKSLNRTFAATDLTTLSQAVTYAVGLGAFDHAGKRYIHLQNDADRVLVEVGSGMVIWGAEYRAIISAAVQQMEEAAISLCGMSAIVVAAEPAEQHEAPPTHDESVRARDLEAVTGRRTVVIGADEPEDDVAVLLPFLPGGPLGEVDPDEAKRRSLGAQMMEVD